MEGSNYIVPENFEFSLCSDLQESCFKEVNKESIIVELKYNEYEMLSVQFNTKMHEQINTHYYSLLSIEGFEDVFISRFAPYLIFDVSDLSDIPKEFNAILNHSFVNKVFHRNDIYIYPNDSDYSILSTPPALEPDPGLGGGNNGSDEKVRIGILDGGVPDVDSPDFPDIEYQIQNESIPIETHATEVSLVLLEGLSSYDSYSLFLTGYFESNLYDRLDWLVDNEVEIINMSISAGGYGEYDSISRYIDYITYTNDISLVVASGNNNLSSNPEIRATGAGFNTITVGALDDYVLDPISSYQLNFTNSKPNLVEFGHNIDDSEIATSWSTPRVTAKIANLMNLYPDLRNNLTLLHSILYSSSSLNILQGDYNNFNSSGLEEKVGAGKLDYPRANYILQSHQYQTISHNSYASANNPVILFSKSIFVQSSDWIKVSIATTTKLIPQNDSYALLDITDYRVYIFHDNQLVASLDTPTNIGLLTFQTSTTGTYNIVVKVHSQIPSVVNQEEVTISYHTLNTP